MTELSRRRLLSSGVGALSGAAVVTALPPSLRRALAEPAPAGGMQAIEHVVVFMQENRSFDSYFGTLRGVRGFADRTALELPGGGSVFSQPDPAGGSVLPFSARAAAKRAERPASDVQYLGSLDHGWESGYQAWADGWMDHWIPAKTASTMAYYDRRDIPLHYELAETFTLCDSYHCSLRGPTNPNRLYLWTGNVGYEPATGERVIGNEASNEDTHAGYDWTTYPERLERAGISWQTYQEWDNYQCNSVEYFVTFKNIARKALSKVGGYKSLNTFFGDVIAADEPTREDMLAKLDEGLATLSSVERSLYDRGMRRVPEGRLAESFRADVAADKLPRVSYIVPPEIDCEHPSGSTPANSAGIIYQVLDALASNPDVWSKTALFLTFDENDGYFDHVPPPVPSAEHTDEFYDGKPLGLGQRVPMTIVSPWTVGGTVCSELFDHTSVVRFLEEWTGVAEPNISRWRRTAMGDLTSAFLFDGGTPVQQVDEPPAVPPSIEHWTPQPPTEQTMPVQEPGRRPVRPLPYRPEASARLTGRTLEVSVHNTGERSAHLALYGYAGEFDAPKHLDIQGERFERIDLPDRHYRLALHGPNGFLRTFAGQVETPGVGATVASTTAGSTLSIQLGNRGETTLTFHLDGDVGTGPEDVVLRPGQRRTVHWSTEQGWYDLGATLVEDPAFHRRLAGHLENAARRNRTAR